MNNAQINQNPDEILGLTKIRIIKVIKKKLNDT